MRSSAPPPLTPAVWTFRLSRDSPFLALMTGTLGSAKRIVVVLVRPGSRAAPWMGFSSFACPY